VRYGVKRHSVSIRNWSLPEMKNTLSALIALILLIACTPAPTGMPLPMPTVPTVATPTLVVAPTASPLAITNTPTQNPTTTPTRIPSTPTITSTPRPPTLRELASKRNFNIGVFFGGYGFSEYVKQLRDIQSGEFNLAMMYLGMELTQPKRGEFNFDFRDYDMPYATKSDMKILGHPLIWYNGVPVWLKSGKFSRNELIDIMITHITTVMNHYKGRMNAWIVVNEAYVKPSADIFYSTIGPEYVEIAFQVARETDPSAILIYNEFDNDTSNGRFTQHTRDIVQKLKSKNLVDAVGLQMHLQGTNPPDKQDVIATMRSYGLPVYVTEFDVNMKDVSGTQTERFALQARIYKDMLEACLESRVCNDFIVFGIVDKLSVYERDSNLFGYSVNADPTPFDDNFQPKPAYFAMRDALSGK
jgi:endo-1,4-beta-xylanase